MKTETLSVKRDRLISIYYTTAMPFKEFVKLILQQDREFIQKLKDLYKGSLHFHAEIDKLAGEELANYSPHGESGTCKKKATEIAVVKSAVPGSNPGEDTHSPQETTINAVENKEDTHSPQTSRDGGSLVSPDVRTPTINQASPEDTQKGCGKEIKHLSMKYAFDKACEEKEDSKGCGKRIFVDKKEGVYEWRGWFKCKQGQLCPKCSGGNDKIQFIKSDMVSLMRVAKELKKGDGE